MGELTAAMRMRPPLLPLGVLVGATLTGRWLARRRQLETCPMWPPSRPRGGGRRSRPTPPPSVDVVLDLARFEREMQLQQFDAVDAKAGIILGFAGVIIALVASVGYPRVLLYLPVIVLASLAVVTAIWVLRSRKVQRQSPEDSYAWWANEPRGDALWQAYSGEVRTLRANDPIVRRKVRQLRSAWLCLAWAVGATVAAIVTHVALEMIGVSLG